MHLTSLREVNSQPVIMSKFRSTATRVTRFKREVPKKFKIQCFLFAFVQQPKLLVRTDWTGQKADRWSVLCPRTLKWKSFTYSGISGTLWDHSILVGVDFRDMPPSLRSQRVKPKVNSHPLFQPKLCSFLIQKYLWCLGLEPFERLDGNHIQQCKPIPSIFLNNEHSLDNHIFIETNVFINLMASNSDRLPASDTSLKPQFRGKDVRWTSTENKH